MTYSETSRAKTHAIIASVPFFLASTALLLWTTWSVTLLSTFPIILILAWIGFGIIRLSNTARIVAMIISYMVSMTLPFSVAQLVLFYSSRTIGNPIILGIGLSGVYVFWSLSRPRVIKLFIQNELV